MAKPEPKEEEQEEAPKKASPLISIAVIAVLSLVSVGLGFFMGQMIQGSAQSDTKMATAAGAAAHGTGSKSGRGDELSHGSQTVMLEPIIVTLPKNDNAWLRLELALVLEDGQSVPDETAKTRILADVARYLRSSDMNLLYSPSGYLHLQDDLLDRARLATDGSVSDVLILTMVVE
ncbi:flagellar basal body-associated FliL family protein [Salaquimonas pukyongi]|uniref:flagellar basal body-associated FliL family protein n=1 Tax=Salaquimonas pukyongi TaxID=2712698 RepID=UPI00096B6871|nr:flagellar basal body-associated FliL family protein [Salaquimonas pukyongi]